MGTPIKKADPKKRKPGHIDSIEPLVADGSGAQTGRVLVAGAPNAVPPVFSGIGEPRRGQIVSPKRHARAALAAY